MNPANGQEATVMEIENEVQTSRDKTSAWTTASTNQKLATGERIRTREESRATLALSGLYTVRLDEDTTIEISPALFGAQKQRLDLERGTTFIFSREKEGEIDLRTPTLNGALRGTQLFVKVSANGKSFVQVIEGAVDLDNRFGRLRLEAGEAGEAAPGGEPRRTPVIEANNILQWALYYPAVIDPNELGMTDGEKKVLALSLAAYQKGNLLEALKRHPKVAPSSTATKLYHASVLLSVGRVDDARLILAKIHSSNPGKRSLERMISAVTGQAAKSWPVDSPKTCSEAMAESYYLQSLGKLDLATVAARRATELGPNHGFAWTRLAELEFSAAQNKRARVAIERGLLLTPENPRAHSLQGFILSSENRMQQAHSAFENAVRLDGGFGNGWLGLGLAKIKMGQTEAGRTHLQTAATVEPTSSIFHSYLAKAMSMDGRKSEAAKDFALAKLLDPNDPTPFLYSAIEKQQNNQPNAAIADLETSILLNDNRRLYRSEFLLDQDRAVRNANLASIYQNAGMKQVAVREATRAVENDYTSSSAHLFLANSFDALRDPDRILLRYETPWFNELLLANLLSPVGGGPLSQFVSQQEYSKLLEADGIGGSFNTQWRSTSETRTNASIFGTDGNFSYGIDAFYRNDPGNRRNSESKLQEVYAQFKWQASPDDLFYFLGKWSAQKSGDTFETFDNQPLSPGLDFEENQEPGLQLAGWNHRWAPGSNTLFLGGRLAATQYLADPSSKQLLIRRDFSAMIPGFLQNDPSDPNGFLVFTDPSLAGSVQTAADGRTLIYSPAFLQAIAPYIGSGTVEGLGESTFDFVTRRSFEIYSAEMQHILQNERNTLLFGGRLQQGTIDTEARLNAIRTDEPLGYFSTPAADQKIESDYRRIGLYAYDYWSILPNLILIGGLSWDKLNHPENFRNPPITDIQRDDEKLSGKLGVTFQPAKSLIFRGAATQGIGGLSFDESVRLEPSQVAGFSQAFRTVISESLAGVGSVEAPHFQTLGLSAEGSFPTRTWWGVSGNVITQKVDRMIGSFTGYSAGLADKEPAYFPSNTAQELDYTEGSISFSLNQLVGEELALGASYRYTHSKLDQRLPELMPRPGTDFTDAATLQELTLSADWNSPTGFFAHVEVNGFQQDLEDDPARTLSRTGDEFVQVNAWLGYRFAQNQCEVTAGVLNLGNTDYELSPLNPYADIARERTLFVSCRLAF